MSSPVPSRITLTEVANQAGTSVATVSYVLNDTGSVGAETRERVLSALQRLGYQARKRSRQSRLGSVAMLWVNTSSGWQQSHLAHTLIQTIGVCVQEQGGHLRSLFYNEGGTEPLPDVSGDNALLISGMPSVEFLARLPADLPRLNVVCATNQADTSFLDIDHLQAGYDLASHLIGLGHRHIGFVSNNRTHRSFGLRYLGYLKAMDECGLPVQPQSVLRLSPSGSTPVETSLPVYAIEPELEKMFAQPEPPTAIIAANDWLAAAVYQYAQRNGIRIPDDISVAGFDNDHSICSLLHPPLTTHSVPFSQIGEEAVRWLAAIAAGTPPHLYPAKVLLSGELIVRESAARLPEPPRG